LNYTLNCRKQKAHRSEFLKFKPEFRFESAIYTQSKFSITMKWLRSLQALKIQ